MRNTILLIVLIVTIATATGLAAEGKKGVDKALPLAQSQVTQIADEKAVRSTAEAFTSAFNKGDAKAIAALLTTDCEYVDETGRIFRGRDAIEKEYAAFFAAHPKVQIETSVSSLKMFGDKAAAEDGTSIVKNVDGSVDKKTQRVAWTMGDNKSTVVDTGLANLTKDEGPALLHFVKDRTEEWLLVRLKGKADKKNES